MRHPQHKQEPSAVQCIWGCRAEPTHLYGWSQLHLALDLRLLQPRTNPGHIVLSERIPTDFKVSALYRVPSAWCRTEESGDAGTE